MGKGGLSAVRERRRRAAAVQIGDSGMLSVIGYGGRNVAFSRDDEV
jgi:hypothetical protein